MGGIGRYHDAKQNKPDVEVSITCFLSYTETEKLKMTQVQKKTTRHWEEGQGEGQKEQERIKTREGRHDQSSICALWKCRSETVQLICVNYNIK